MLISTQSIKLRISSISFLTKQKERLFYSSKSQMWTLMNHQTNKQSQLKLPKSVKYKTRQHVNPLSNFSYPVPKSSRFVDFSSHFPKSFEKPNWVINQGNTERYPANYETEQEHSKTNRPTVDILDVGWGYGNLLLELSVIFKDQNILGMEIREKVTDFVIDTINSKRLASNFEHYMNVSAVRTNAMKWISNYIDYNTLSKIFVCFPDPYFKRSQFKRRIINEQTVNEFAQLLKKNGRIYTVTDIHDLYLWNTQHLRNHKDLIQIEDSKKIKFIIYMNTHAL